MTNDKEMSESRAVQLQLRVWDALLEVRIRLQTMLIEANRLPQDSEHWKSLAENTNPHSIEARNKSLLELMEIFFQLKVNHLSNFSMDEAGLRQRPMSPSSQSQLDIENYETELQNLHETFTPHRNQVIQKWNDRTQVASGKLNKKTFSAFQISTLKQIEQIMADKERLIRRTKLKRTRYEPIGKATTVSKSTKKDNDEEEVEENYDPEIFDDDDFYHQMLREFIERKTSNVTNPLQLSRHWLELQKLRSKTKKKVDTKASKARKIRYEVYPKLVNLMAPSDETPMTDHARKELFASLFGSNKA